MPHNQLDVINMLLSTQQVFSIHLLIFLLFSGGRLYENMVVEGEDFYFLVLP